jgi:hypothetical protein
VLSIVQVFHHIGNVEIGSLPTLIIQGEYFLESRVLSQGAVTSDRPNEFCDGENSLVSELELLRKLSREQGHVGELVLQEGVLHGHGRVEKVHTGVRVDTAIADEGLIQGQGGARGGQGDICRLIGL